MSYKRWTCLHRQKAGYLMTANDLLIYPVMLLLGVQSMEFLYLSMAIINFKKQFRHGEVKLPSANLKS